MYSQRTGGGLGAEWWGLSILAVYSRLKIAPLPDVTRGIRYCDVWAAQYYTSKGCRN